MQITTVLWSLRGLSMHRLALLLRGSAQAVRTWIRDMAKDSDEQPEPPGRTIVLPRDAMWQYRRKKRGKRWIGKALEHDPGQRLDWEGGRRDKATLQKMGDRLAQGDINLYGTDTWATDAAIIPPDQLVQRKATPHPLARHHGRQRHGFGRCKRQSIMVSQSQEMVELTMALFARFWVHGNQDELLSLLG